MPYLTRRVTPAAPPGTWARGWNDRCAGLEFIGAETEDWKSGWLAAGKVPADQRRGFNDTLPTSGRATAREE